MCGLKVVHGETFACSCGTFLLLPLHRIQRSISESSFCGKNYIQQFLPWLYSADRGSWRGRWITIVLLLKGNREVATSCYLIQNLGGIKLAPFWNTSKPYILSWPNLKQARNWAWHISQQWNRRDRRLPQFIISPPSRQTHTMKAEQHGRVGRPWR